MKNEWKMDEKGQLWTTLLYSKMKLRIRYENIHFWKMEP